MDLSLIVSLHLEAGSAWQTLNSLGRQTETQVFWMGNDIDRRLYASIRTPAVHGLYSAAEAWCAALKGTGLMFEEMFEMNNRSVWIRLAHPGEYEALCQPPVGWGPDFIHPPLADWK